MEEPFITAGQIRRMLYFSYFLVSPIFIWFQDKICARIVKCSIRYVWSYSLRKLLKFMLS